MMQTMTDAEIARAKDARRAMRRKKRAVSLWAQADVATAARVASETTLPFADGAKAWPAGARLIELMWETSADQTDVVTWRRDQHFRDGPQPAIAYARGKTGEEIVVPISHALAAKLRGCGALYFVTDPAGAPYKADNVHDDNRRGGHYRLLQDAIEAAGGRRLLLDHLRHSGHHRRHRKRRHARPRALAQRPSRHCHDRTDLRAADGAPGAGRAACARHRRMSGWEKHPDYGSPGAGWRDIAALAIIVALAAALIWGVGQPG